MKNVYDIRYEKNLTYILSQEQEHPSENTDGGIYAKTAVILYLYYIDTLTEYWPYLDGIQEGIDLYIISSREELLEKVREHMSLSGETQIQYILKENRGRDVSALLVTSADLIKKYEYVCFLHDKKEHCEEMEKDTELWRKNLWGNLIGSSGYIDNILGLFTENPKLGILAPPEPIGDHFCAWYGDGWANSFTITKELADRLKLNADIDADKPPITLGTALWFQSRALHKLFAYGWKYSDFDDEGLKDKNYLSYGIERLFAYIAQDAGFETGTVMTAAYAEEQTSYVQHAVGAVFSETKRLFPMIPVSELESYRENRKRMVHFARLHANKKLYLYGTGTFGRFCFFLLREANLLPDAYLVSETGKDAAVCGLPVYLLPDAAALSDSAVIITVFEERIQKEMIQNLEERGLSDYLVFWA